LAAHLQGAAGQASHVAMRGVAHHAGQHATTHHTASSASAASAGGTSAAHRASGTASSGDGYTIVLELDKRVIARSLAPYIPDAARIAGVRLS
jgi:hypothetical protein